MSFSTKRETILFVFLITLGTAILWAGIKLFGNNLPAAIAFFIIFAFITKIWLKMSKKATDQKDVWGSVLWFGFATTLMAGGSFTGDDWFYFGLGLVLWLHGVAQALLYEGRTSD